METRVINIRDAPDGWKTNPLYVYIGRANGRYGVKESKWANPHKQGPGVTRHDCVYKYQADMQKNPDIFEVIIVELQGQILVCWCAPKMCHGHILIAVADGHMKPKRISREFQKVMQDKKPRVSNQLALFSGVSHD